MFDLQSALLDLDEDAERLSRGICAVGAVSAAIAQQHRYGDGLEAVWEYLEEAQRRMRRDLDLCIDHMREQSAAGIS